jgi:hypothetical protein
MGFVTFRRGDISTLQRFAAAAVLLLLVGAALLGFELGRRAWQHEPAVFPSAKPAASAVAADRVAERPVDLTPGLPAPAPARHAGSGVFTYAQSLGPILGRAGALRRFRVAVEDGGGEDADVFGEAVEAVLGDQRSWIGSGRLRLQRVPGPAASEFTVYLATPVTSERMCAETGLRTRGYSSCRTPRGVIINSARWWSAVPGYGADREVYRAYVVNHETGHELGHGHEPCPGPGRLAPVMQQQTHGLAGCVANAWPFP